MNPTEPNQTTRNPVGPTPAQPQAPAPAAAPQPVAPVRSAPAPIRPRPNAVQNRIPAPIPSTPAVNPAPAPQPAQPPAAPQGHAAAPMPAAPPQAQQPAVAPTPASQSAPVPPAPAPTPPAASPVPTPVSSLPVQPQPAPVQPTQSVQQPAAGGAPHLGGRGKRVALIVGAVIAVVGLLVVVFTFLSRDSFATTVGREPINGAIVSYPASFTENVTAEDSGNDFYSGTPLIDGCDERDLGSMIEVGITNLADQTLGGLSADEMGDRLVDSASLFQADDAKKENRDGLVYVEMSGEDTLWCEDSKDIGFVVVFWLKDGSGGAIYASAGRVPYEKGAESPGPGQVADLAKKMMERFISDNPERFN